MSPVNNDKWELMSQIMRPGGHLLLGTSEANACTSLVAHIEKHYAFSHGNGNAFRVHKKIRQTVATG